MRWRRTSGWSSPEQAGGTESKRGKQQSERDGGCPRWTEKGGRKRLREPEKEGAAQGAPDRAHAAQHADREQQAAVVASEGRLYRLDDDQERSGDAGGRDRERKRELLHPERIDSHQAQRELILRDGQYGSAEERVRQEYLYADHHRHRNEKRHHQAQGEVHDPQPQGRLGISGLHHAVVDAEDEHQRHFGDEQDAEEEGEAAQRFLAAFLETE